MISWRLAKRTTGNVAHGKEAVLLEFSGVTFAYSPKIGDGGVGPQFLAVAHFIQLGDADPVFIGGHFFRHNVHGDFSEVQIGADASCGGDASFF